MVVLVVLLAIFIPLIMIVVGTALFSSGVESTTKALADRRAFKMQRDFYKANPGATQQDFIQFYIAQKAKQQGRPINTGSSCPQGEPPARAEAQPIPSDTRQPRPDPAEPWEVSELEDMQTPFGKQVELLSSASMLYDYVDFCEGENLSTSLAFCTHHGYATITERGEQLITNAFVAFCEYLGIDPMGNYESIDQIWKKS